MASNSNTGISLGTILFIVFLVLKLCGVITWSWWWVTAPLWIPISLSILLMLIAFLLSPSEFKEGFKQGLKDLL